jgi:hypothetical protein
MGVLDDAIREHLELKRKHGASEGEIVQQEQEALGASQQPAEPVANSETAQPDVAAAAGAPAAPAEPETAPEPAPEPEASASSDPDPTPAASRPMESKPDIGPEAVEPEPEPAPEAVEPEVADPAPESVPAALDEDEPDWDFGTGRDESEQPPSGDTPPQGFERVEDVGPPAEGEEEDVLEETPDFLQETPEHDRLWFEQKPPRDFDFDE